MTSPLDIDSMLGIIGGLGLPALLLQFFRNWKRQSPRERLLQDIEIRKALHSNSDAQRAFDEHIKAEALRLAGADSKRRDPFGITLAVIFLILGGLSTWAITSAGGAWWFASPVAGFFLIFGFAGLALDAPRKERDERGRRL